MIEVEYLVVRQIEMFACGRVHFFAPDISEVFGYTFFVDSVGLPYILFFAFSTSDRVYYISDTTLVGWAVIGPSSISAGILFG